MGPYPLKNKRLQQLYDAGFNIADFICFPPHQLDPVRMEKFFERYKKKGGISLRHFHQDENRFFKCPVKYEVTDWKTALNFCQEHNQQFYSLINQAIPLSDAIYGDNIWLLDNTGFMVEYFEGPGSPRDTESKQLKHFRREIGQPLPEGTPQELVHLGSLFRNFIPEERPIVIEFNIYPYPMGKREETSIIWEWRQGLLHETAETVQALLEEIDRLKLQNETLQNLIMRITSLKS